MLARSVGSIGSRAITSCLPAPARIMIPAVQKDAISSWLGGGSGRLSSSSSTAACHDRRRGLLFVAQKFKPRPTRTVLLVG
jgi:hypothetical protein